MFMCVCTNTYASQEKQKVLSNCKITTWEAISRESESARKERERK